MYFLYTHISDIIFRFNLEKKVIFVDALVNLDVKNMYELSGKILIVPVRSNGDASIKLSEYELYIAMFEVLCM